MAGPDIGEPRNRQTPGVASPEQTDVLGSLPDLGAAIKYGIAETVVKNAEEKMEKVPEEAAEEAEQELARAQEVPAAGQELTGDPEVDKVRANIGRLQAVVGATTGSARARAQLELRRVIADSAARFPGLRERLAQEMRLFEATDPEMQLLANIDTNRDLLNAAAQKELDEIRDFAYARAPNGLGLSPGLHTFGSKEFSAHVAYKGALIEEAQTRALVLEDANTQSMVTAESKAEGAINFFNGAAAPYRQAISVAAATAWQAAEAARNVTSPGASEQLLAWNQGGKQEVVANLQAIRAELVADMGKLFSSRELAVSETAKQAQAMMEAELEAMDQVVAALSGDETDWSVVKAYEAYNTFRQAEFDSRFPAEANARLLLKNLIPFIDASDGAFGNVDAIPKNMLANYSINTMNTVGKYLGVTSLMAGAGMPGQLGETTPTEVLDTLGGIRQDNMALLTNGQSGTLANQSQGHLWIDVTNKLKGVPVAPDRANDITLAHASALLGVRQGNLYDDLTRDALIKGLGSDDVLIRANQARDAGFPLSGRALGEAAREADTQYQKVRESQWVNAINAPLGAANTSEIIRVDTDGVANGKIQFVVDDEALATIAITEDPLSGVGSANLRKRAADQAAKMSKQFTEDLKYLANMDALLMGADEPDYALTYGRYGFNRYLAELEDE